MEEEMPMPKDRNVLTPPSLTPKQMREVVIAVSKAAPNDLSKFAAQWLILHQGDMQDYLRHELRERLRDAEEVAWWQEIYMKLFGLKADYLKMTQVMPESIEAVGSLVVVPPNLPIAAVISACENHFALHITPEAEEHLAKAEGTREQDHPKGYVIRTRSDGTPVSVMLVPNTDLDFEKNCSYLMTLKERLLLELARSLKDETTLLLDGGRSLDTGEYVATLCAGPGVSRYGWMTVHSEMTDPNREWVVIDHYATRALARERSRRQYYGRWVYVGNDHVEFR